jgi:hypothetical protein
VRHLPKTIVAAAVILLLGAAVAAAGSEDRSYTRYLEDDSGQRILQLTVTYLGKAPVGDFQWQAEVDWHRQPLDFYTLEWTSLAVDEIAFVKTVFRNPAGNRKQEYRVTADGRKAVLAAPGVSTRVYAESPRDDGNVLGAFETKTDENYFYGLAGDAVRNVLQLETTFRYQDQDYVLRYYLVGTRGK